MIIAINLTLDDYKKYKDIITWIDDNDMIVSYRHLSNAFQYEGYFNTHYILTFSFTFNNEQNAILFKLTWG